MPDTQTKLYRTFYMRNTYQTGISGEEKAETYLTGKGMKLLEKRYREKCGEIDLILLERETIVFVEVKTRLSDQGAGTGLAAVNPKKQYRISKCAALYLLKHNWLNRNVRFDEIEINQNEIIHLENAFQPGGMFF